MGYSSSLLQKGFYAHQRHKKSWKKSVLSSQKRDSTSSALITGLNKQWYKLAISSFEGWFVEEAFGHPSSFIVPVDVAVLILIQVTR